MTKRIGIILINTYQAILSPILKSILGAQRFCRFEETCSDYTKRKINEKGLFVGVALGVNRLAKCQPFYNMKGAK